LAKLVTILCGSFEYQSGFSPANFISSREVSQDELRSKLRASIPGENCIAMGQCSEAMLGLHTIRSFYVPKAHPVCSATANDDYCSQLWWWFVHYFFFCLES
jgi:hypothetical protein